MSRKHRPQYPQNRQPQRATVAPAQATQALDHPLASVMPAAISTPVAAATEKVVLAGRTYVVEQLPIIPAEEWRARLRIELQVVAQIMDVIHNLKGATAEEMARSVNINLAALAVKNCTDILLRSMTIVLELMYAYSPALEADRNHIGHKAFDGEAIDAFLVILQLAYPAKKLRRLMGGLIDMAISKS